MLTEMLQADEERAGEVTGVDAVEAGAETEVVEEAEEGSVAEDEEAQGADRTSSSSPIDMLVFSLQRARNRCW